MNEDYPEPILDVKFSSDRSTSSPQKTCAEPMEDDSTFNVPSISADVNQGTDGGVENNINSRTDFSVNSCVNLKPSTSGKPKRRSGTKKHRAGRNRKRKWKPYFKLTWEERRKLDERNARRAQRHRDEMSAVGRTLAPYNTNQFLINDYLSCHVVKTPDFEDMHNGHEHEDHHSDSSDEHYQSCSDNDAYYKRQFLEDYENVHEEYLKSLSHYQLAEQYVGLEDKIEVIDKQLKDLRDQKKNLGIDTLDPEAEMEKIDVFRIEIEKLFQENLYLEKQNEKISKLLKLNS